MNHAIIYSSRSGNTKYLAEQLHLSISDSHCIHFGSIEQDLSDLSSADIIFAGFWTDKGDCEKDFAEFLNSLHKKKVFLFGTAGFGRSEEYFQRILNNVSSHLPTDATIIGSYMCQGKMPVSVRKRYEGMMEDNPDTSKELIANFDEALKHPNEEDFEKLMNNVKSAL